MLPKHRSGTDLDGTRDGRPPNGYAGVSVDARLRMFDILEEASMLHLFEFGYQVAENHLAHRHPGLLHE